MSFHRNQKVVCVDAKGAPELTKGAVYTIFTFLPAPGFDCLGRYTEGGVTLHEVEAVTVGFAARRFRPVKDTSIEVFRQMLVTPPKEVVPA